MNIFTILFIIVLIVLLFVILRYLTTDNTILTTLTSATTMQTISASSLAKNSGVGANNFSYSIWFYVNDWNYKYGEPKVVFGRMGGSGSDTPTAPVTQCPAPNATNEGDLTSTPDSTTSSNTVQGVSGNGPCPLVILGAVSNNLDVNISVFPGADASTDVGVQTCSIANVPVQRWVNLLISVYGRTLDVYLDGKLVKTCVLAGIAKVNNNADVYVTPSGGFSGWTSKLQYFTTPTDPQTAWNIYKAGYGDGMFSNIFSNYQVKVSVINNGSESSSLTI